MTLEEYVQYETEKALRNGKVYNLETTTYGKIKYVEDIDDLRFFETEFPAIVYEDALSLESGFSYEPTVSSQHVDDVTLKNETSLSEYDDEEYNVTSNNDLFPFNIYLVGDSKLYMNNDDDKMDINDKLEWVLWYAPWLSDQLELIYGMLHGLLSPFPPKKFRMGVAIATGRRGYYKPGTWAWREKGGETVRQLVTKMGGLRDTPEMHEYQLTDKEKEIERMMIYWEQVEYEVSDEDDSDLKSMARSVPKDYEMVRTRHNNDDDNGQPNLAALIAEQLQNIIPQIVTQVTTNVNNANGGNGGNNGCSYKGFQACGPKEYDGKGVR
ncbi:hypothetical protein Tco_1326304 [Tanacetum coccineum]